MLRTYVYLFASYSRASSPNASQSGKSSLVNSLLKKPVLPIYLLATSSRGPTTTEVPHEVSLSEKVTIIDTPGLSWVPLPPDDEAANVVRARDILMRNKGRIDRLKDPEPAGKWFDVSICVNV